MRIWLAIPLLLFLLGLGSVKASTFYLNSTQATVNDTFWNSGDEYAPYLTYTNPYAQICSDLRSCYIDDTNSGTIVNMNFLKATFFNNDTNLQPFSVAGGCANVYNSAKYKYVRNGTVNYYLVAIFNDTSKANSYRAVVQRGTVVDIYNNLTLLDELSLFTNSGCVTSEDSWNIYAVCKGAGNEASRFAYFSNNFMDLLVTCDEGYPSFVYTTQFSVISHLKVNEIGYSFLAQGSSGYVFGSNNTDFTSRVLEKNGGDAYGTEILIRTPETYFILEPAGNLSATGGYVEIQLKPTVSRVATLAGNYRSVALPLCSDIAVGNTQTLMYYQNGYWIRSCQGVVPTPTMEQFTCNLKCTGYSNTYTTYNKTIISSPIGSSALSYSTHASLFNRNDYFNYIFDSGTDLTNVKDLRVYTYIEFESYNESQRFGVYGASGLSTSAGTSSFIAYLGASGTGGGGIGGGGAGADGSVSYNIPLYTRISPVDELDRGAVKCFAGQENVTEYTVDNLITRTYFSVFQPMYGSGGITYYPFSDNYYINTWWKFSDIPFGTDCNAINPDYFPYSTPVNSSTKHIYAVATWRNVSAYNTSCTQYEPVCTPVVPEGYTYNASDIICVGQHCYVYAQPIVPVCNNDTICDSGETYLNCPSDCKTPTSNDAFSAGISSLATLVSGVLMSMGVQFGIGYAGAKFSIWSVVIIIGMIVAGSASGNIMVGAVSGLIFMLLGVVVGWIPVWVGIILIVLTALLIGRTFSEWMRGG